MRFCGKSYLPSCKFSFKLSSGLLQDRSPLSLQEIFKSSSNQTQPNQESLLKRSLQLFEVDGSHKESDQASLGVVLTEAEAISVLQTALNQVLPKVQGFRMAIKMLTPSEKSQLGSWFGLLESHGLHGTSNEASLRETYFLTSGKK